jgi:hypothetical protein
MFDEHARDFLIWVEHSCSYGPAACDLESSTQTGNTGQVTFLVKKLSVSMIDGDGEWSMSRGCDATSELHLCRMTQAYPSHPRSSRKSSLSTSGKVPKMTGWCRCVYETSRASYG